MASYSNTSAVTFPVPSDDWADPTFVGIWTAATGGTFLGRVGLSNDVDAPTDGATVSFAATMLVVEISNDDFTVAGAQQALNGYISGTRYISLHSADPGTDGSNELSGNDYARVAIASTAWS